MDEDERGAGAGATDGTAGRGGDALFSTERAKAFIDAVVAIALTLLILPLIDAVTSAPGDGGADAGGSAAAWLGSHGELLLSFALSFAVIAMFWIGHHRMFARVRHVTTPLLWLNMAWLATIVWLPVATTLTDRMSAEDGVVVALYIGTMAMTSILTLLQRLYLHAHPVLHDMTAEEFRRSVSADIAMAVLFLISLAVAVGIPAVSYFALFLLMLTGWAMRGVERMIFGRRVRPAGPARR